MAKRAQPSSTVAVPLDIEDLASAFHNHEDSYHAFKEEEVTSIREALLGWYDVHRRHLPWRGDPPPYGNSGNGAQEDHKDTEKKGKAGAKGAKGKAPAVGKRQMSLLAFTKKQRPVEPEQEAATEPSGPVAEDTVETAERPGSPADGPEKADRPRIPVSAYGTWVSEVMLQQTRVETVIEYYLRWMERFPSVQALAAASDDDINSLWAGLGYYRRARMLKEGAQAVVHKHNGELPSEVAGLLTIPGIGPYTSGAIASIAFNKPTPLVDGNVLRVLSRVRCVAASPKHSGLNKWAWRVAEQLVHPTRPGDFNQALMELGATVCTPKSPRCASCPLAAQGERQGLCLAARMQDALEEDTQTKRAQSHISKKKPKTSASADAQQQAQAEQDASTVAVESEYLMVRRPAQGLLAGQWEFPTVAATEEGDTQRAQDALRRKVGGLVAAAGTQAFAWQSVGEVRHVFSHVTHDMQVVHACLDDCGSEQEEAAGSSEDQTWEWVSEAGMVERGVTTGVRKILKLLESHKTATKKKAVFKGQKKPKLDKPTGGRGGKAPKSGMVGGIVQGEEEEDEDELVVVETAAHQ